MIRKGLIESALTERAIKREGQDDLHVFYLKLDFPYTSQDGYTHHDYILAEKVVHADNADSERKKIAELLGKTMNLVIYFDIIQSKTGNFFQNTKLVEARIL